MYHAIRSMYPHFVNEKLPGLRVTSKIICSLMLISLGSSHFARRLLTILLTKQLC